MGRFINPFTDVGFKRIFGQEFSKPLLLDFLNSLLKGEREIVDITFLDKEQPAVFSGDRSLIYDIYCETTDKEHIIVEMQNREQPFFKKRSIYYTCEAISRQGERGAEWNYGIKAVYFIAFLNFKLNDIGEKFRTDVALTDLETKERFSGDMRMIYLQLPYFTKDADSCENDLERWIYVLKNMEALNRLPWAAQNSMFERLAQIADISALSKEERLKYDEAIKKYRDTLCVMEGAVQKGLAEGLAEGLAKGLAEGHAKGLAEGLEKEQKDTIMRLHAAGYATDMMAVATGLSIDEVNRILASEN